MKFFKKILRLFREEFVSILTLCLYKVTKTPYVRVKYFKAVKNWGDILNVYLIEKVTGKKVLHHPLGYKSHILGIGSVIASANDNSNIWGSGLMYEAQSPKSEPKNIYSVRGPKTYARLTSLGINVPEVFGDPCIVLSKFYEPKVSGKKYKLGIIPHYVDKQHPEIQRLIENNEVLLIDIQQEIEPFIDQIVQCENIASSSLHGMIAADTYSVPNCRILLSDGVVGGSFKFDDYHLGIGCEKYNTISINSSVCVDELISLCTVKHISELQKESLIKIAQDKLRNI